MWTEWNHSRDRTDKPTDTLRLALRELCIDQLEVSLGRETLNFVSELFHVLENGVPGMKEAVDLPESASDSDESLEKKSEKAKITRYHHYYLMSQSMFLQTLIHLKRPMQWRRSSVVRIMMERDFAFLLLVVKDSIFSPLSLTIPSTFLPPVPQQYFMVSPLPALMYLHLRTYVCLLCLVIKKKKTFSPSWTRSCLTTPVTSS